MSSGSASFTDTAIQGKLEPPRSLHDVEDAEVIWDTITRRFPNAAPLLCEMETVIERAEDLLQQLKTPCAEESDTSSSFHTPDSRESNVTISSDIESFTEETNVPKRPSSEINAEAELAVHVAREQQATDPEPQRSEQSVQCETECPDQAVYHSNSPSKLDKVVQHLETSLANKCQDPRGESSANVTDRSDGGIAASSEERLMARITEQNSLEGWTKMADSVLQEWQDDVGDAVNDNDSETRVSVNRDTDNNLLAHDEDKTNSTDDVKVTKTDLENNVARNSATSTSRSPLTVLEEYAKRCQVSIKYENKPNKPKPNLYVINGDLCGFRAMSCADTQDLAKNELAAKILWLVAERQMNGSKLSSSVCGLSDFSREEMLATIEFNKDKLKNASQKLYKICLEKEEATPEYSIHSKITNQGNVYEAQCVALGLVGIGQGKRKDNAKIAAAESLYQKYMQEMEQQTV